MPTSAPAAFRATYVALGASIHTSRASSSVIDLENAYVSPDRNTGCNILQIEGQSSPDAFIMLAIPFAVVDAPTQSNGRSSQGAEQGSRSWSIVNQRNALKKAGQVVAVHVRPKQQRLVTGWPGGPLSITFMMQNFSMLPVLRG